MCCVASRRSLSDHKIHSLPTSNFTTTALSMPIYSNSIFYIQHVYKKLFLTDYTTLPETVTSYNSIRGCPWIISLWERPISSCGLFCLAICPNQSALTIPSSLGTPVPLRWGPLCVCGPPETPSSPGVSWNMPVACL